MAASDNHMEAVDRLNDYWDEVVREGAPAPADVDPELSETIRLLHALGREACPSTAFAVRLRRSLLDSDAPAAPPGPVRDATVLSPLPLGEGKGEGLPPDAACQDGGRQGRGPLWRLALLAGRAAAAVLLVAALGAIGVTAWTLARPLLEGRVGPNIAADPRQALVELHFTTADGRALQTGVSLGNGQIVTVATWADGPAFAKIEANWGKHVFAEAELVKVDRERGLALLQTRGAMPPAIGPAVSLEQGDLVRLLGREGPTTLPAPSGGTPDITSVLSVREGDGKLLFTGVALPDPRAFPPSPEPQAGPYLEVSAQTWPGLPGGLVLDSEDRPAALVTLVTTLTSGAQGTAYALPLDEVRRWAAGLPTEPTATPTPSPASAACPAPTLRPTYAPWGAVGAPREEAGERGVGHVYDGPPDLGWEPQGGGPTYLRISRQPTAAGLPPGGVVRSAGSRDVRLLWVGDPGVGDVAAWWQEGQGPCDTWRANLLWRQGGREEIERQLLLMVASLASEGEHDAEVWLDVRFQQRVPGGVRRVLPNRATAVPRSLIDGGGYDVALSFPADYDLAARRVTVGPEGWRFAVNSGATVPGATRTQYLFWIQPVGESPATTITVGVDGVKGPDGQPRALQFILEVGEETATPQASPTAVSGPPPPNPDLDGVAAQVDFPLYLPTYLPADVRLLGAAIREPRPGEGKVVELNYRIGPPWGGVPERNGFTLSESRPPRPVAVTAPEQVGQIVERPRIGAAEAVLYAGAAPGSGQEWALLAWEGEGDMHFEITSTLAPEDALAVARSLQPRPPAAPPANITYRPAAPDGRLITSGEAESRVRQFLGEPDASFDTTFEESPLAHRGGGYNPVFYVRRPVRLNAGTPDTCLVDARTGEVISAALHSNEQPEREARPVTKAEAAAIAEELARSRFAGFAELELTYSATSGPSDASLNPRSYYATWQKRAADSGAWLPLRLSIAVSLQTGRVTSYAATRADYAGPTAPKVSLERALETAKLAASRSHEWAAATVKWTKLEAVQMTEGYRLVWVMEFENERRLLADSLVDALTGELLVSLGEPSN